MFRRTKPEAPEPSAADQNAKNGGKGRPTPTRKEAEAAAKARAKGPADRKAANRMTREHRSEESRKIRQALKDGDERYLPNRDKGPVRRFIRDFVDARLCMAEFAVPLLFASLAASAAGFPLIGSGLLNATLVVVVLDSLLLWFRLRRQIGTRFPDASPRGNTFYALTRSMQLRFMRLPKPQVKLGQQLPQRY